MSLNPGRNYLRPRGRRASLRARIGRLIFRWYAKEIYVTGGEGYLSVFQQDGSERYRLAAKIPSGLGARTSGYFGMGRKGFDLFYVALPARANAGAEVLVYTVQQGHGNVGEKQLSTLQARFAVRGSALLLGLSPLCPTQFLCGRNPAPGGWGNPSCAAGAAAERLQSLIDLHKLSSETRAFSLKLSQKRKEVRHGWKLYSLGQLDQNFIPDVGKNLPRRHPPKKIKQKIQPYDAGRKTPGGIEPPTRTKV